jgi:ketosteroid isomerase-like protein
MSREAIDPIRERIDAAWLRSDADGITRGLAEDAVLMPPNAPKQVGRKEINDWLKELFRHYSMTELAMPERELTVSGDVAVERSLYEWTLTPVDGGAPIHDRANWVGIWRKDSGGAWAEVCGIWNSCLPPGGSEAMQVVEEGASSDKVG